MATETLRIVVTMSGDRVVKQRIRNIGTEAKKTTSSLGFMKSALGLLAGSIAVREMTRMADAMTNVRNRVSIFTKDTAEANAVIEELFTVANKTRTSFEATAKVYARMALATSDLGLSQRDLITFQERLNKATIVSGARTQEANAAMIQLSQGLAAGALRGDELRSVLEQLPYVADIIARGMGKTRGELKKMGEAGLITSKSILEAFNKMSSEIDAKFGKTVPTLAQSFEILRNHTLKFIDDINQAWKITSKMSAAIIFLGENIKTVAAILGAILLKPAFFLLARGISLATTQLALFSRGLLLTPLGILTTIAGIFIGYTATLEKARGKADEFIETLTFGTAKMAATGEDITLGEFVREGISEVKGGVQTMLGEIKIFFGTLREEANKLGKMLADDFDLSLVNVLGGLVFMIDRVYAGLRLGFKVAGEALGYYAAKVHNFVTEGGLDAWVRDLELQWDYAKDKAVESLEDIGEKAEEAGSEWASAGFLLKSAWEGATLPIRVFHQKLREVSDTYNALHEILPKVVNSITSTATESAKAMLELKKAGKLPEEGFSEFTEQLEKHVPRITSKFDEVINRMRDDVRAEKVGASFGNALVVGASTELDKLGEEVKYRIAKARLDQFAKYTGVRIGLAVPEGMKYGLEKNTSKALNKLRKDIGDERLKIFAAFAGVDIGVLMGQGIIDGLTKKEKEFLQKFQDFATFGNAAIARGQKKIKESAKGLVTAAADAMQKESEAVGGRYAYALFGGKSLEQQVGEAKKVAKKIGSEVGITLSGELEKARAEFDETPLLNKYKNMLDNIRAAREKAAKAAGAEVDLTRRGTERAATSVDKLGKSLKKLADGWESLEDAMFPVRAAMRELVNATLTLDAASRTGLITHEHAEEILARVEKSVWAQINPMKAWQKEQEAEIALLQMSNREREREIEFRTAVAALEEAKGPGGVTEEDEKNIRKTLEDKERANLLDKIRTDLLQQEAAALEELEGPLNAYNDSVAALNRLYDKGHITQEQLQEGLNKTRLAFLQTRPDMGAGVERAILRIQEKFKDTGSIVEGAFLTAFDQAENAMVEFLTSMKFSMKDLEESMRSMINTLLGELARLAIRKAIGAAVTAIGFQHGGSFEVGGQGGPDSQLVMFRATPGERVDVTPQGKQGVESGWWGPYGGPPPGVSDVNVKVVNQSDPMEMVDALTTPAGERVIMNVIRKHRASIRRTLV